MSLIRVRSRLLLLLNRRVVRYSTEIINWDYGEIINWDYGIRNGLLNQHVSKDIALKGESFSCLVLNKDKFKTETMPTSMKLLSERDMPFEWSSQPHFFRGDTLPTSKSVFSNSSSPQFPPPPLPYWLCNWIRSEMLPEESLINDQFWIIPVCGSRCCCEHQKKMK